MVLDLVLWLLYLFVLIVISLGRGSLLFDYSSLYLGIGWLLGSIVFILVLLFITYFVLVFSFMYMNMYVFYNVFVVFVILFVFSMILFLISESNHVLFFGWDMLGLVSFFLVMYYNNWVSLRGSLETLMRNRFGDLFLIFFIVMGGLVLKRMTFLCLLNFLLVMSSWTKRVQFPFHGWLVKAIEAPTPVSSLVHSSTLVTAGFVLFMEFAFEEESYFLLFMFISSFVRSLIASLLSLVESDVKQLVAWRTMSQISLVFLFYCFGYSFYAWVHLISHAFFKSLLFILIGFLINISGGDQDFRKLVISDGVKFVLVGIMFCLFSLMALFFLGGMLSKDLFLEFGMEGDLLFLVGVILLMEMVITFFYSYKMLKFLVGLVRVLKFGFSFSFYVVLLFFSVFVFYFVGFLFNCFLFTGFYSDYSFYSWVFFLGFYFVVNFFYYVSGFLN